MSTAPDILDLIRHAVLDLQNANYQTYHRPLRSLGRLLRDDQLASINAELTEGLDLEAFLSGDGSSGMAGSAKLLWPDDPREELGYALLVILKCAADPDELLQIAHHFYYTGAKLDGDLHAITSRLIIPFERDYRLYVQRQGDVAPVLTRTLSKRIFIVHGHDNEMLQTIARFVSTLDLEPVILHEQANRGRTVIEKVEAETDVGFAIVLLTPDDEGRKQGTTELEPRARQNVLLELGYFLAKLGRPRVCALRRGEVNIPSDFAGVVWEPFDDHGGWKVKLCRELEAAGYDIDWKKLSS